MAQSRPTLFAVAAGSCSGKSVFADRIRNWFMNNNHRVSVLNWDDYYKSIDDPSFPKDDYDRPVFDVPNSYQVDRFRDDALALLSGQSVESPLYDKKTNKPLSGQVKLVESSPLIVTEGIFVVKALNGFSPNIINIFIHADRDVRIARRIARDVPHLHDTKEEALRFIEYRVEPYYIEHIDPQRDLADIVIINN